MANALERQQGNAERREQEEDEESKTFEELGLEPSLIRALIKKGIEKPTPIQEVAIPLILVSLIPYLSHFDFPFMMLCLSGWKI